MQPAYNDEDIYEILSRDIEPFEKIYYEFIVLDEIQDMTKAHYKYLMKFIKDMNIKPVFLIIGDVDQSIFEFKGADSRYLTMCDQLEFQGEFVKKTLTKTFRLTKHMVSFINEAVYGYTKYTSLSNIEKPFWNRNNIFQVKQPPCQHFDGQRQHRQKQKDSYVKARRA